MAIDRLIEAVKRTNNPTVAGVDTKLDYLPEGMAGNITDLYAAAEAVYKFNCGFIDALCGIVPAVKVQVAYYEMYGSAGMDVFNRTMQYASGKGMVVIADAKRNDIGSTAEAYASAFLGETMLSGQLARAFSADMLTVNPYLGSDGVKPFIEACIKYGKSIFVLVKTSNPASGELQDLKLEDGRTVYEAVADLVKGWGSDNIGKYGYSCVGAVVGATYPIQGEQLRKRLPNTFLLVPGYGAQGATARDIRGCFDENGGGAIVNASRSLLLAYRKDKYKGLDFMEAARAEAIRMRDEINAELGK